MKIVEWTTWHDDDASRPQNPLANKILKFKKIALSKSSWPILLKLGTVMYIGLTDIMGQNIRTSTLTIQMVYFQLGRANFFVF